MATVKKMLYQQLTDFLLTKLPKRYHGNFYSWIEDGKLLNEGRQVTENGIEVCHLAYNGVFHFEALPFNEISPAYLMAFIQVWVNENDQMRDLLSYDEIPFDLDMIDDNTADLIFTIAFHEPLTAMEDKDGALKIDGVNYRLDEIDVFTAEYIDIVVNIEQ
ncbi:phage tail protein [Rodentibacter pneumotropicus]|uniref:Phage tail protein n=1 Tax=Rodentibacter pneumotropicus TaxID=758 RepID=A0A4V3SQP0_9PAST|nr:phage tail protein [Rodentibacter pneumotropicus]THA08086.1 phage tail protein [Rodentibacter pneumotropicus]